ncbi:MAG: DUF87 domain-containing protein [Lachnospiraceae bacterium]|jgi:S-DNA-T family DNA segregation ATPase FtsK/SpoIIIE|nr:DUF87 domain-containing protein [Lachnospiraceae bacterium]
MRRTQPPPPLIPNEEEDEEEPPPPPPPIIWESAPWTEIFTRPQKSRTAGEDFPTARIVSFLKDEAKIGCTVEEIVTAANVITYHVKLNKIMDLSKIPKAVEAMAADFDTDITHGESRGYGAHFSLTIPRGSRETVWIYDVMDTDEFRRIANDPKSLPVIVGMYSDNTPAVLDIGKLPHMLICGTSGSGKSVVLNSMLISAVAERTPDQLQLLMIDPKETELIPYDGLPHLFMPIITETYMAAEALGEAVEEMDWRQKIAAEMGVRTLGAETPYLLVVIDELADLMLTSGKYVESSITRLAQKGRALKIHVICATQSPMAKVTTNLIRANLSARLAFRTTTDIESRIALGRNGCTELLGNGDGWLVVGTEQRVQAALSGTDEIEALKEWYCHEVPYNAINLERRYAWQKSLSEAKERRAAEIEIIEREANGL